MKGVVKKTEFGWVPFSQDAQKVYDKMVVDELAMVECTRNRNYENHKRFFELRDQTFEIQDEFECDEQWRKQLLILAGHYELKIVPKPDWWDWMRKYLIKYLKGPHIKKVIDKLDEALGVQLQAKSMAFEKMDETEFRDMFTRAVNGFLQRYAQDMDDQTFMRILDFD